MARGGNALPQAPDRGAGLTSIGFAIESAVNRDIGGETFLWVTASKPEAVMPPANP